MLKVSEEIRREHEQVEQLMAQLEQKPDMDLIKTLFVEIRSHHIAEESVVFPLVRNSNPEAAMLVDILIEQHKSAAFGLGGMQQAGPTNETFPAKLFVVKDLVQQHVQLEEERFLPMLEQAAGSQDELESLTQAFESAKTQAMATLAH